MHTHLLRQIQKETTKIPCQNHARHFHNAKALGTLAYMHICVGCHVCMLVVKLFTSIHLCIACISMQEERLKCPKKQGAAPIWCKNRHKWALVEAEVRLKKSHSQQLFGLTGFA